MLCHGPYPFFGRLRIEGRLCVTAQVGPLLFDQWVISNLAQKFSFVTNRFDLLARLTRQRDMLKTERFFNTFRERAAVYYIAVCPRRR